MSFLSSFDISASGMSAQRLRMDIAAENIANVDTTRTEAGGAYQRKDVVFESYGEGSFAEAFRNAQLGRGFAPWENLPYEMLSIRRQNYNHYVDSIKAYPGNVQLMEATSGGRGSISSSTGIKVIPLGGIVENIGITTIVRNADEALILLAADTTFREENPTQSVIDRLSRASLLSWDEILDEHIKDYQSLFNRVTLKIEG